MRCNESCGPVCEPAWCLAGDRWNRVDHCIEAVGAELMTAPTGRCNGKVLMFGHDETAAPPIKLKCEEEVKFMEGF